MTNDSVLPFTIVVPSRIALITLVVFAAAGWFSAKASVYWSREAVERIGAFVGSGGSIPIADRAWIAQRQRWSGWANNAQSGLFAAVVIVFVLDQIRQQRRPKLRGFEVEKL